MIEIIMVNTTVFRRNNFLFPARAREVVLIAEGSGISSHLKIIYKNNQRVKAHLIWGGRTKNSFEKYLNLVYRAFDNKLLSSIHISHSQQKGKNRYVQDLVMEQADLIAKTFGKGGVLILSASLAKNSVIMNALKDITQSKLNVSLKYFQDKNQLIKISS